MKKLLKKLLVFCLAFVMVFPFVACDKGDNTENEIKNLIIVIGDGMGLEHVKAGGLVEGEPFVFANWHQTTANTDSLSASGAYELTDSAASGTALATGELTHNAYVGKDPNGENLETIMDIAKEKGKATGVMSTEAIHGATPAAFSGHSLNRGLTTEIVASQIETSNVDLLCGHTDPMVKGFKSQIESAGYSYCETYEQIWKTFDSDKAFWQFDLAEDTPQIELYQVTALALSFLSRDEDGFVLMIEQAYVDKFSHNNDFKGMQYAVRSLNATVETILDWIGDKNDTAVIVTADHETGGLMVSENEDDLYHTYETLDGKTISYQWSTGGHTQTPVGVFTYNIKPDFSDFRTYNDNDIIKNIEIFQIMNTLLENPKAY